MRTPRTPSIQREGCARWPERMCASPSRGAGAREASRMVARLPTTSGSALLFGWADVVVVLVRVR